MASRSRSPLPYRTAWIVIAKPDPLNPFSVLYDRAVEKGWFVELTLFEAPGSFGFKPLPRLGLLRVMSGPKQCKAEEKVSGNLKAAASRLIGRLGLN